MLFRGLFVFFLDDFVMRIIELILYTFVPILIKDIDVVAGKHRIVYELIRDILREDPMNSVVFEA